MAKDVAWHCPYKDGVTKPTATALEKHMGDHHRTALAQTITAGKARAAAKRALAKRKKIMQARPVLTRNQGKTFERYQK